MLPMARRLFQVPLIGNRFGHGALTGCEKDNVIARLCGFFKL
jgi:hypothetical protein